MQVFSEGIVDGIIDSKFGKYGNQFNEFGMPTYSLGFKIVDAPIKTKSFAFVLEDKDAIPVCGFSWIHWVGANLIDSEVSDNVSQSTDAFVQGLNSWISIQGGNQSKELSKFYGGMAPPDKPHVYELHVYAIDCILEINDGFYMNELFHKMDGHVLDIYTLKGTYNN